MLHEICIKLTPSRCVLLETIDHAMPDRAVPCHTMPYTPSQVFQIFFIKFNEEIVRVCVRVCLVHYDSSGLIYVLELLVFPNSLKMQSKWKLQQEACTIYHDGEKIS